METINPEETRIQIRELNDKVQGLEQERLKDENRFSNLETKLRERDTIEEALLHGERITGTTHASAGTASEHTHTLGQEPIIVFITPGSNGIIYLTAKDSSKITVKGSANSLDFVAYLLI